MSVQLLDKTRKMGKLLHNNQSNKVLFDDLCNVLSEIMSSNIVVLSKKGKVIGVAESDTVTPLPDLIPMQDGERIDPLLNERLLSVLSTRENINLLTLGFEFEGVEQFKGMVTPIEVASERLGTLFVYKTESQYLIDDIILTEYAANIIGLEMLRSVHEENAEEVRKLQVVRAAVSTLSFSELEAINHIFDELDGNEGVLVASKVADRVGITRSVIVNALRKFESAGIIESKSSGMKGTYIKVVNDLVYPELERAKTGHFA